MPNRDKALPRVAMLLAPDGKIGLSQVFRGSVEDMKGLANAYGFKALYCVSVKSVKPDAPGYFEWFMTTLGIDFETHGHA
jgi:hypothetical protein